MDLFLNWIRDLTGRVKFPHGTVFAVLLILSVVQASPIPSILPTRKHNGIHLNCGTVA